MNKFSIMRLLKHVMLVSALVLPAMSWADSHLLDIVVGAPPTVFQKAIVPVLATPSALTQSLILAGFNGEPANVEFGLGQSLTLVKALVKMCAPGTGGNLEWLDQG